MLVHGADRPTAIGPEPVLVDDASRLEVLLELASSAREDPLPSVLETVAEIVCETAGFRAVVVNLFRPAWDDYEVALVIGEEESVTALMGTATPRARFRRIFAEAEQPPSGRLLPPRGIRLLE